MQKIAYILFISLISTGCFVSKKPLHSSVNESGFEKKDDHVNSVINQNLTENGFYIQKALVEIDNGESRESLMANLKFLPPDTFLISLRGRSGIEAVRIFITGDTVLVNDRINRELLYGRADSFTKKYGIMTETLPLLVGDYVGEKPGKKENINCIRNVFMLEKIIHGLKLGYVIDCKINKILSVTRESSLNQTGSRIEYDKFVLVNGFLYPSEVHLQYREMDILIKIQKIESPWKGKVEFIPGNKYELIELL